MKDLEDKIIPAFFLFFYFFSTPKINNFFEEKKIIKKRKEKIIIKKSQDKIRLKFPVHVHLFTLGWPKKIENSVIAGK